MDLLKFGMENNSSESAVKKALAKGALAAAKKQADLYEAYVNKQEIEMPKDPKADEQMLEKIQERIAKLA